MREISDATLNALADKFEALELSEDERAIVDKVLQRAAQATAETTGFVASEDELIAVRGVHDGGLQGVKLGDDTQPKFVGLSPMAIKLGSASGLWP